MHNSPRILIVEDDGVLTANLQMMLLQMGYQIAGLAATGAAAVEIALAQIPDAILMDIHLRGDMNGIQATAQIHQHMDVPVIFLSAFTDELLLQEAKVTDAYAYLAKPIRDRELRASLEMAFYKHSAEQRMQDLNQVLRALRDINQVIIREHDPGRLLDQVCQILRPTRAYRFVNIFCLEGERVNLLAQAGDDGQLGEQMATRATPEQFAGLPGVQAYRTRQVVVCQDMVTDPGFAPWREDLEKGRFASMVSVPICYDDRLMGVLSVFADQPDRFNPEEVELLEELAGDIAFGLKSIAEEREHKLAADALRESRSTLKAIVDSTSDMIWSVDPETFGLLTFNQGLFDYFLKNCNSQIQAGMRPEDLFSAQEEIDHWRAFYQQAVREGPYNAVYEVSPGSNILQLNFNILRRDDQIFGVSVFGKDITESSRAQEQLQLLKYSIDTAPDSAFWMDIRGNFIYVNDMACRGLGYTRSELLRMNVQEINPKVTSLRWAQVVQEIREKKNFISQSIHRRKDGSEFPVEINSAYIQFGDQEYINGFAKDITERKHAEEILRESEEKYRVLVENSVQGVILYQDYRLAYVNPRLCEISGYSVEELVPVLPLHSPDFIHPDDRERVAERTRRFLHGDPVDDKDSFRLIRKDGEIRHVETFSRSLTVEGKPAGIVTMVDVTERNLREQELQAIATLSAALRTAPTRAEMLPVIVAQIAGLIHSETVTIEIIDPSSGDAVVEAALGFWKPLVGLRQAKGTGLNLTISQTLKPFLSQNIENDPKFSAVNFPMWAREGIRAAAGMPLITQEKLIGFIWIGRKTEISNPELRLLSAIADITANAIQRATSHEQTLKAAAELAMAYDITLEGWAHALELRDQETEGHARRVTEMTVTLARASGIQGLELENVRRGALLHDIGKMGIPDSVLLKPGTLNEREWEIMRRHTEYARDLLMPIDYLRNTIDIPFNHHEKWDGTGYPRGLKEEEIPLAARLFAVADVWDALTSDRPYRKAWPKAQAIKFICDQKGKHFDPAVVDLFMDMIEKD